MSGKTTPRHVPREFRAIGTVASYIHPDEGGCVLVLTRRANQSIMIGEDVVVTVLEVRGDQVRLGIVAPREVEVHREEVFRALHGEPTTPPREIDVTDDAPETSGARRRRRDD